MNPTPRTVFVVRALTPAPVWDWLMAALETPYSDRSFVELLADSDLYREVKRRIDNDQAQARRTGGVDCK